MQRFLLITLLVAALVTTALAIEPAVYNLAMMAGEDFRLALQLKDGAGKNLNLTGYSYRAQFRAAAAPAGAVYATYSCIFSNVTGGRLRVSLSKAQTVANSGKQGSWDLQQTDSGGAVTYIIRGSAAVSPTVTR